MSNKPFDICVTETFQHNGQEKTNFHRVGSAFETKDGTGFTGIIPPGISISGRFLILPRKEKTTEA